jgi:hypothetical protein
MFAGLSEEIVMCDEQMPRTLVSGPILTPFTTMTIALR